VRCRTPDSQSAMHFVRGLCAALYTMSVEVVPIAEHHIAGFRAALDSVARERKYLVQIEAQPLESVRAFVIKNIKADLPHFVATEGNLVLGWCDIIPGWAHAIQHRGTVGMGVLSQNRFRGIGSRLLGACLEKAKQSGISRVELEVRADNTRAIRLYERFGFIREANLKHALRIDDQYHDAIQMSLIHDPEV
jgi:ribosomal protein S18 acetylase RimI-like enzyme